jgi:hypothetical protein
VVVTSAFLQSQCAPLRIDDAQRGMALKSWNQAFETANGFGKTLDKRSMVAA